MSAVYNELSEHASQWLRNLQGLGAIARGEVLTTSIRDLWPEWFRLIQECRPPIVLGEQVDSARSMPWLERARDDLTGAGYSFGAAALCASLVGLPPRRRLWFVAHSYSGSEPPRPVDAEVASLSEAQDLARRERLEVLRVDAGGHGASGSVARRRAYGNALAGPLAAFFVRAAWLAVWDEVTGS